MITGAAASTVLYNLRLRHPTLELPIIDYDLALLFQPMLILGISIGVTLNVLFSDWMITILLIIIFVVCFLGFHNSIVSVSFQEAASVQLGNSGLIASETLLARFFPPLLLFTSSTASLSFFFPSVVINKANGKPTPVYLSQNYSTTCSVEYWLLNTTQIPVAVGVTSYVAVGLYKGRRKIASKGEARNNWPLHRLFFYCVTALMAGIGGGMLGLGGGFILGPLFLEMGIPPQVSSATAAFAMMFSASISAVEFYLLKRFPIPYALYFFVVATISAVVGQHVAGKLIRILGRASLIIFTLAFIIFASAILLGGVGIGRSIRKIERNEYMGFENICS
nr:sulfite exporter TauE/SafE family protein 3-like [Populus alba]